ncbi:MAG: DUF1648 domain-containing protein [Butyricicoccus sp.]
MQRNARTRLHRILETAAWLLWLASFGIAIYAIATLPDTIATHFTLDGTVDGYGSPSSLLLLPIIMLFAMGTISLVVRLVPPENWNTPFVVREECKEAVYRTVATMLYALELEIAGFTLYSQLKSYYQSGTGVIAAMLVWFALLTVTIVGLSVKAYRINQAQP